MTDLRQNILDLLQEEFGEYSHFEVKGLVAWDTPDRKAEFIRDIQSLCNSLTDEKNRYLVIGYNKHEKSFEDVENIKDFDDGRLVSLLSAYFEPEITFKSYAFTSDTGENFIVLEFPSISLTPPHLIKKEITQQNKEALLHHGEIWIKGGGKGGSSAKRRANREDLYGMFDLYIERQSEKRAQIRVDEILKSKQTTRVAQELILPENFDISIIYREDEVFVNIVRQLILGEKSTYLRELTEAMRHNLLTSWKKLKPKDSATPEEMLKFSEVVYDVKSNQILPTMSKLTILATQLIRARAYPLIFETLINTLSEFYYLGYDNQHGIRGGQNVTHPTENLSYSVPAIESMTAFNLLGAYALKVDNFTYLAKLVNLTSKWDNDHPKRHLIFLFLAGHERQIEISELRNPDGKTIKNPINFFAEKGNYLMPQYFEDGEDLLNWLSSFDLVREFNSHALIYNWEAQKKERKEEYLAIKQTLPQDTSESRLREIEEDVMGEYNLWNSPYEYHPSCISQDFQRVSIILERFISLFKEKKFEELKYYFVKDKHNKIDYSQFDKFIYEAFEAVKNQRAESNYFSMSWGWIGAEVERFLEDTKKKYSIAKQTSE